MKKHLSRTIREQLDEVRAELQTHRAMVYDLEQEEASLVDLLQAPALGPQGVSGPVVFHTRGTSSRGPLFVARITQTLSGLGPTFRRRDVQDRYHSGGRGRHTVVHLASSAISYLLRTGQIREITRDHYEILPPEELKPADPGR